MSPVVMAVAPECVFKTRIVITQLIDPVAQLLLGKQTKKSLLMAQKSAVKQKKAVAAAGESEESEDSVAVPSFDTPYALTVPLLVAIDEELEYGLLVRNEPIEIKVELSYDQVVGEEDLASGIRLVGI